MGLERKLDVPVGDLSVIRGMWEVRVKKHRQRQKKEQQRVENSALARIDQQWQYRIYCKTLKSHELNLLHRYLERSTLPDTQPRTDEDQLQDPQDPDQSRLILQLDGDRWTSFPRELQWKTYLREWHVRGTRIRQLPDFLALFTQLTVLEIPKNAIAELPPEIGKLTELRELNVSYNRLSRVPPELGHCENLQRLELRGNHNLSELSFELSSLKRLVHLDIAENRFVSIPVCALRMSRLQLLDLSSNRLSDLPQDMDRFIRLCDNTKSSEKKKKEKEQKKRRSWRGSGEEEEVKKDGREKEFIEAYVSTLKDRGHTRTATSVILYIHHRIS
ncbi:hypothetical protein F2P81_025163 [Scophthalmus maximus]|uniref:Disease resistance R13L4/SHOC-2-like LRR domain-containing protein n=1 Tax=Scophthalmus maximus TaxID=52904 RepID=A0A6A4RQI4_SCOMX|nr:hypothetical protein F2P81_025163 [Scophthalmus maximus]